MPESGKCWIVGRRNGVGLEQDAALLAKALTDRGWRVETFAPRDGRALLNPFRQADAIVHLERVFPLWKVKGGRHFLIPNQERFPLRQIRRLRIVDHVLCKSRHATEIFSKLHRSVKLVGFTSPDRLQADTSPDYARFFHLAGKSTLKNTGLLLELWTKHPEWPVLTLVQHPDNAPANVPANVNLVSRYLADCELRDLQNSCGIHLCPSLSEGWGHYIVEAMSSRAVTVTTDAPPMNELVTADRGVTVPYHQDAPRHLGRNFQVDPAQLEAVIIGLIHASNDEKMALGESARRWFEANDRDFSNSFPVILGELCNREAGR